MNWGARARSCRLAVIASGAGASLLAATALTPATGSHLLDRETLRASVEAGTWDSADEPDLSACGALEQYDEVVTGTPGDDRLGELGAAGAGRQLIVGLGGDDVLYGG